MGFLHAADSKDQKRNEPITFTPYRNKNLLDVDVSNSRKTPFGEQVSAYRSSSFNFKPTWGLSLLRNTITTTGTGAAVIETNGEGKLSTGTTTTGVASIRTKERGQYQAGTQGEVGVGIRIPTNPTGTQNGQWGYFDDNNGFGYGIDSTGVYVFKRTGGIETKTYQGDWNVDIANGKGASGLTLDITQGIIFQIDFTWYGYGEISFYITTKNLFDSNKRVLVHTLQVNNGVSIVDPNQPITITVENGGTTDSNFDLYFGGRQFSVVSGDSLPSLRVTSIELPQYTVTSGSYVPVASIRKKTDFNGRENSVNAYFDNIEVITDSPIAVMYDFGGSTTGGSWVAPSDVSSDETALEVNTAITGCTPFTAAGKHIFSSSGNRNNLSGGTREERIVFGQSDEVAIFVKKFDANANVRVVLDVKEEW